MFSNKVLLLNDVNLLKRLEENGYKDIANILKSRKIDGKQFLNLSEFETRSWNIPKTEQKKLFSFIEKLKADPSLIIKQGPVINKHKPTLTKPNITASKPSFNTSSQNDFKHNLSNKLNEGISSSRITPNFKKSDTKTTTAPHIESRYPEKISFSQPDTTQNVIKPKPLKTFRTDIFNKPSTYSKPLSMDSNNDKMKPISLEQNQLLAGQSHKHFKPVQQPKPIPNKSNIDKPEPTVKSLASQNSKHVKTFQQSKPLPTIINYEKPLPTTSSNNEPSRSSRDSHLRTIKPLPMEPEENKPKPKAFLPEPTLNITAPLIKENNNIEQRSPSPETEYEEIDKLKESLDYGYLSPKEFDFINNNSLGTNVLTNDQIDLTVDDDNTENTYESPPKVKLQRGPSNWSIKEKESAGNSPVRDRVSTIPTESNDESESDDEDRQFKLLPNDRLMNLSNNMRAIAKDLEFETPKTVPNITSHKSRKCTIGDLQNILIVSNEEEPKRATTILGSITKFFSRSSKSNYENHTLKSEFASVDTQKKSSYNRPLPDIPEIHIPSRASSLNRHENRPMRVRSPDPNYTKSLTREKNKVVSRITDVNLLNSNNNEQILASNRSSLESKKSYKSNNTDHENEVDDLGEYENKQTIKTVSSRTINLTDQLALKLSEQLNAREWGLKEIDEKSSRSSQNVNTEENVRTTPETFNTVDENEIPIYGNVEDITKHNGNDNSVYGNVNDSIGVYENEATEVNNIDDTEEEDPECYVDSIFNINNEKFYRNTDRRGAKLLLNNLADGAFLFRPSRKYFLVLTIKYLSRFYNLGIERTTNNRIRLNADMSSVSPEFGTLRAFVEYFKNEAVTFRDNNNLVEIFLNPVLPPDLF